MKNKLNFSYKCRECGADIHTNNGLSEHLRFVHHIQAKEYYDRYIKEDEEGKCKYCGKDTTFIDIRKGYHKFCTNSCAKKWYAEHNEEVSIKCEECGYTIKGNNNQTLITHFNKHLKSHNLTNQQYYDKYLKKPGEGFCSVCGKPTTYYNILIRI